MADKELKSIRFPGLDDRYVVPEGGTGGSGQDGYSPSAKVEATADGAKITITDKTGTTEAEVRNGKDGAKGEDGYSPSASVSQINGGARIVITDKSGTTGVTVMNGGRGQKGDTPVITAEKSGKVTTIKADGVAIATVNDGEDGTDGKDGAPGAKGDTGATPDIQIGTVTTLDAGADATAIMGGTAESPLLNLGIPKGADGGSELGEAWVDAVPYTTLEEDVSVITHNIGNAKKVLLYGTWRGNYADNSLTTGSKRVFVVPSADIQGDYVALPQIYIRSSNMYSFAVMLDVASGILTGWSWDSGSGKATATPVKYLRQHRTNTKYTFPDSSSAKR